MAFLLGCENVHLEYPAKKVLDSVSLGIDEGDRVGIVGRNGDGKSSLLSLLAGSLEPDRGRIIRRTGATVGMLQQTDALDLAATVAHAVVGDVPEYTWASDARIRGIIQGLIEDIPWEGQIGTLSGGQRRRVDLARVLVDDCDVLMLDEPTNHLDVRAIAWLAEHLKSRWPARSGALLVVTHDRWFLDEVASSMWEVHGGRVEAFEGGYSAYVLQRVEREQAVQAGATGGGQCGDGVLCQPGAKLRGIACRDAPVARHGPHVGAARGERVGQQRAPALAAKDHHPLSGHLIQPRQRQQAFAVEARFGHEHIGKTGGLQCPHAGQPDGCHPAPGRQATGRGDDRQRQLSN